MLIRARFDRVMENLIFKGLKKNYGQSPQRYANLLLQQHENQIIVQLQNAYRREVEMKRKQKELQRRMRAEAKGARALKKALEAEKANEELALVAKKKAPTVKGFAAQQAALFSAFDVSYNDLHFVSPKKLIAWCFTRRPSPATTVRPGPPSLSLSLPLRLTAWSGFESTAHLI